MTQLRIKFEKVNRAKFISHLDLSRCMARAFRRADIPIWFTQGFNPHPYIFFALPLSLGTESVSEYMDIKLDKDMSPEEVKARLTEQMPEGLLITDTYEPIYKFADIAFSEYIIRLEYDGLNVNSLTDSIEKLKSLPSVLIEKKTKSALREINIKEYIDKAHIRAEDGCIIITVLLPSGNTETINPSCFAEAIENYCGIFPSYTSIKRVNVLKDDKSVFN